MFRPLCIAAALTLAAAGAAHARGGPATLRDCVSAGFFEITAVSSAMEPFTPNGGGGYAYQATIATREFARRGFRVEFNAPGATQASNPQGYTLAQRGSIAVTLGRTPRGQPRLSDSEIRQHTRVMCWA